MRRLLSLLLASTMILVACGNANNENKKKGRRKIRSKKEAKKNNDKPKNEKKNQDINKTIMSKFKMSIINNQS